MSTSANRQPIKPTPKEHGLMSEKIVPFHGENFVCNNSFLPNLTSSLILESVLEIGVQNRRVLDLRRGT